MMKSNIHTAWTFCALLVAGAGFQACEDTPSKPDSRLRRFYTCGDPVCSSYRPQPGIPPCTIETAGEVCAMDGATCDPIDACNRRIVCTAADPATMCPISRIRNKQDIHYLSDADLARLGDELLSFRLATYTYRADSADGVSRLGFLIDDVVPSAAVEGGSGDRVDLYGYISMAVAALQTQARQIDSLEKELEELKREFATRECAVEKLRPR